VQSGKVFPSLSHSSALQRQGFARLLGYSGRATAP